MLQTLKDKLPLAVGVAALFACVAAIVVPLAVFVAVTVEKPCKTCPAASAQACACGDSCVCHPCTLKHYPSQAGPFSTACPYCRRSIVVQPTGQVGEIETEPE